MEVEKYIFRDRDRKLNVVLYYNEKEGKPTIDVSKSCPQCRCKVTAKCMFRLYPTISNESNGDDAATLQSRLDDTTLQLRQEKTTCREKDDKLNAIIADLKKNEEVIKSYEKKLVNRESAVSALKEQMEYLKVQNKETSKLKEENEGLKKNIQTLNGLQKVLNATSAEVEQMLQGYSDLKTPSEFAILNAARNATHRKPLETTSIFHMKQPLQPELCGKQTVIDLDMSYDGLGGHSKLDTFPVPLIKAKSCVPKLTAKHKLKRPTPSGVVSTKG
ncbi:No poles [Operophtera brumata]|uniref:No poles n=1 Tax=Operophtera brumata TaxID=104452 RepID=A0A0L7LHK0_OPEBR|nr:No poles [Operophtera brumata]